MGISSVVSLVAGKIGELLVDEAKFLYGVESQVRSLQREFEMMQSFLKDMEAMGEGGDDRSRTAIKHIRRIAFEAEDAIDSYILEASSSARKKEDVFKRYLCFCGSLPRTHQLGCEIEDIKKRINETIENWEKFTKVKGRVRGDATQTRLRKRLAAYPHIHEDHVVGLDEDINKLVGVLTEREHTKIKVVSMVGMGGSGKTTLARKVYNYESVENQFECRAWVSVSQQWDAQQIILNLLKEVKAETMVSNESSFSHQVLVGKLYKYLEQKSYLIVLDDVWESEALQDIFPALPIGGDGGKIILTTRNNEVVNYPELKPLIHFHEPKRLIEEESWELFSKIALIHREEINCSMDIAKFEELGKKMLKKCEGLPLAVIALAGILSGKNRSEDWEMVSKAVSLRIMKEGKGTRLYGSVNHMLALSYIDLPSALKPCFLYLARYPVDHEILVEELIQIWIAEGFITSAQQEEGDTLEDVARQCLDELVHRYLVLVEKKNYDGKVECIRIHDLVRDLCIAKAKEEDFLEIFTSKAPNSNTTTESRRAILLSQDYRNPLPFPTSSQHLRSLIYETGFGISRMNLESIHQNCRLLRVLILKRVGTLPIGIESLIHLRHLYLKETDMKELPSSLGKLRNLLALECHSEADELRIPNVLWKLEKLVHLSLKCSRIVV